jgi:hypothetical protein
MHQEGKNLKPIEREMEHLLNREDLEAQSKLPTPPCTPILLVPSTHPTPPSVWGGWAAEVEVGLASIKEHQGKKQVPGGTMRPRKRKGN